MHQDDADGGLMLLAHQGWQAERRERMDETESAEACPPLRQYGGGAKSSVVCEANPQIVADTTGSGSKDWAD
jgi:hypothetical protein